MRILVISDIHANYAALAAIDEPHDLCLCLGDLVDYGPDPAPCVQWSIDQVHHAIRGNHDHGVAQGVPVTGETGFRYLTRISRPFQWPALNAEQRRHLVQLPLTRRLVVDERRLYLVHGTPRDPLDEYLLPDAEAWARRLEGIDADIVCVGHTHQQYQLRVGSTLIVNPGSVGLPRDGDPRAAYAVIENGEVELKRIEYPVEEAVRRIEETEMPARGKALLTECLRNGRVDFNGGE